MMRSIYAGHDDRPHVAAVITKSAGEPVNNATWGGFGDYITAILWGLGIYQISSQGTMGVANIFSTITGIGQPARS
jgi:hypothetical protein